MATMQATEAGGMLKATESQTFGNCTKDEMTETTVPEHRRTVFWLNFQDLRIDTSKTSQKVPLINVQAISICRGALAVAYAWNLSGAR